MYAFDDDTRRFSAIAFDTGRSMQFYQEYKGWQSDEEVEKIKMEYGSNKYVVFFLFVLSLFIFKDGNECSAIYGFVHRTCYGPIFCLSGSNLA